MVMGDLSSYSLYGLFQKELQVELSILQGSLVNLRKELDIEDSVDMMLLSSSAIYGAARLVDLGPVAQVPREMAKYLRGVRENKLEHKEEELDVLLEAIKMLVSLYICDEKSVQSWIEEHDLALKALIKKIKAMTSDIEEDESGAVKEDDFGVTSSEEVMWAYFCDELHTQAKALEKALLSLEQDRTNEQYLKECLRAAHSIKGAARIVQADSVVSLANACEECFSFDSEQGGSLSKNYLDFCFKCVDLFYHLSRQYHDELVEWQRSCRLEMKRLETSLLRVCRKDGRKDGRKENQELSDEAITRDTRTKEEQDETVLRVSSENINKIIRLSGESYVASHWMNTFINDLHQLKTTQARLAASHQKLRGNLSEKEDESALEIIKEIEKVDRDLQDQMTQCLNEVGSYSQRLISLGDNLYRTSLSCRMRSFADGVGDFPRVVRDLARKLNKKVTLKIKGKTTQVDRDILEKLKAPLSHLLSNAVDHGIETAEERLEKGKEAESIIWLEASIGGGELLVEVTDDGGGMNLEKLKEIAVKKGFTTAESVANLDEQEIYCLAFHSGLTTGGKVTDISGRGVGLDVVKNMVEEFGGKMRISSIPDQGTTFS
ncbi:MAG: two-component system sensor histidine kinase and response regulator WspE, partial [Chlamydiales bacterium]